MLLIVSGDVTLTGSNTDKAGAAIGSNFAGGQTTSITLNAGGNVQLIGGSVSEARIGSPASLVGGGDITVTATGKIEMLGTTAAMRTTGDIRLLVNSSTPVASNIVVENLVAGNVSIINDNVHAGSNILRGTASSLITATGSVFMELENAPGAIDGIGTALAPIRVSTPIIEAHYHQAGGGIFIDSPNPGDMQIGGVPSLIFSGLVRGVQTVSGGPIQVSVNGKLSQLAGAAGCGLTGGTGGPICAGPVNVYNGGDNVTLRANDMDLQAIVSGRDVYLMPQTAGGNITLGSTGTGGSLHLSQAEINQVNSFTLNVGEQDVSGNVTFAGDLTTPALFGIRTGGSIISGANTLTVGPTGDGNIDLYAKTGIQLNIKTATLSAWNAGTTGNIDITENSAQSGLLLLDSGVSAEALRNDATGGHITLITTNRAVSVANDITAPGDITLTAGGDIYVVSASGPVSVSAGGNLNVSAVNFQVGSSFAAHKSTVTATGNLTATLSGALSVVGGHTSSGSGATRDVSAKLHADGNVTVTAAGVTVAAGHAVASGGYAADHATANAELSAGGSMTLTVGASGLYVLGGNANVNARSGENFDANANATLSAGTGMTITVAGSGLHVSGGSANATARSGSGAVATANANSTVSASGALAITVNGGDIVIGGGSVNAYAFHGLGIAVGATLSGNNTATANTNVSMTGGTNTTLTLNGGGNLYVGNVFAHASAYKQALGCSSGCEGGLGNSLSGTNVATANANVTVGATSGNLTINLGAGAMQVGGNFAGASAFHYASNEGTNTLSGNNTATATANISLTAGDGLAVNGTNASVVRIGVDGSPYFSQRSGASAAAFKQLQSGGSGNNFSGVNQANGTAGITLNAAGGSGGNLVLNTGTLQVRGGSVFAQAYHAASYGSAVANTLSGDNTAMATSTLSISAPASKIQICVGTNTGICAGSGAMTVTGARGYGSSEGVVATRAFKYVNAGQNNIMNTGNNTATSLGEVKFTAGTDLTVTAGSLSINSGGGARASAYKKVDGVGATGNQFDGVNTATSTANISFTAGNNLTVDLGIGGGVLNISGAQAEAQAFHRVNFGASNTLAGDNKATANAGTTLTGGTASTITINAGNTTINGRWADASAYKEVNGSSYGATNNNVLSGKNTANANVDTVTSLALPSVELKAGTITFNLGGGNLTVNGSSAQASAYHYVNHGNGNTLSSDHAATANSNVNITATNGALTINAGGGLNIYGSSASASAYKEVNNGNTNTLSGTHTATANSNITLSGTSVALNLGSGSLYISNSSANASAYHYLNNGNGNSLTGNHTATANSNISVTATTGALTIGAGGMSIYGSSASASAYKQVNSGNTNVLSGTHTATANSNISLSGASVTLNLGAGSLYISGDSGRAEAYHEVSGGSGNNVTGNHTATANSNISLTATGALIVNATGGVQVYGGSASARAHKYSSGSNNTLSGTHTATANGNITLSGTSVTFNLGAGSLLINGGSAEGYAYHYANGNGNTLSGNHVATATSNVSLTATTGALTVNATGGVSIYGNSATGSAYKQAYGSNHALSGTNTATVNSNISLSGASVTLALGSGSLYINGSSADARAYHYTSGAIANNLSGNNVASATSNISVIASGALTVNATGGASIYGSSAYVSAYKYVNGSGHTVSGNNTATANSNISLSGTNVTMNLGAGSLYISAGSSAQASAYHTVNGAGNIVSGNHVATANRNTSITATSGALTVNATGGLTLNGFGSGAQASAYKNVSGSNHSVTGDNTATANRNMTLKGATVALNLGTGVFNADGGEGRGIAYNYVSGNTNSLSGNHTATAIANTTVVANSTLTVQAGSMNFQPGSSSAVARAYNSVSGTGNTVGGTNVALMDANIKMSATTADMTLTVGAGTMVLAGFQAQASASNNVAAGNTVTATNTATAHSSTLAAAGGNMTINVTAGDLTVAGGFADAVTAGSGTNTADANANAATFAAGAKTITTSGAVNLSGGNLFVSGTGATAAAFSMVDPASLALTVAALALTPNGGGVILSALGPITLTIGGVATPLAAYGGIPGVTVGQGALTTVESSTTVNITNRFGLAPTFMSAVGNPIIVDTTPVVATGSVFWDGGASTFNWLDAANWSTDLLPTSAQAVIIGSLGSPVTLTGLATIKSLISSAGITLSGAGAALTLLNASSISNTLTITGGGTVAANGGLTVNALNLSSGALNGLANLFVSNGYTHTGGTIAGFGLVDITQASGDLALGSVNATAVSLHAPAGNITQSTPLTVTNNLSVNASGNVTLADPANHIGSFSTLSNVGGNITLATATDVSLQSVLATGNVGVTSGAAIYNTADITSSAGSVSLTANGAGGDGFVQLANGNGTNITAAGPVTIISANDAIVARNPHEYVNITGSSVTLTAASFIHTGVVAGQGNIAATGGDVIITTGSSVGGCFGQCWSGSISAPAGNVLVNATGFADFEGPVTANGTIVVNAGGIYGSGAMTASGITLNSTSDMFNTGVLTAPNINLTSVAGMYAVVNNAGAGLQATNGATGVLELTSNAATFTVGSGGAAFSNASSGGYVIHAQQAMNLNGGTAEDKQATFTAGGRLTANGYSNFGGPVSVGSAGSLYVDSGGFNATNGNMSATVHGDVHVMNGGTLSGTPDINKLTVDGTIYIDGPGSKIEAISPSSIHLSFPMASEGGYVVNTVPGQIWDPLTNTGFFAGGLPAVLGGSLQVEYGVAGLPPTVVAAINNAVSTINKLDQSPQNDKGKDKDKDKDKDSNKEKGDKDEKSLGGNVKLQCN